jgi:hypothetical protein
MQIPQGIVGWSVFATGLLIVAYRIHGIDAPRVWVETMERQFTYGMRLRYVGGILLAAALALTYFGGFPTSLLGRIFTVCVTVIGIVGMCLLFLQNHLRHLLLASAEGSDNMLRIVSIVIVLIGLGLMVAPFFF